MIRSSILVSSPVRPNLAEQIARGEAPRRDYFELRDMLGAELLVPPSQPGRLYNLLRRAGGNAFAMCMVAWQRRNLYDVLLTDQETVGLLLAMLFKLTRTRKGHVMLSHYLTPFKKQVFYKWFGAQSRIDRTVCYSTAQERLALGTLGLTPTQVALVLHPADSHFWCPAQSPEEEAADLELLRSAGLEIRDSAPLISSAGLEFRDYATLIGAVRKMPEELQVIIAASSPWSKRADTTQDVEVPANVRTVSLSPLQLRALYRRSLAVAVPLFDVDFQAGSLVAYEAMACGKPVVITKTRGQNDIVSEGETGFYVAPGDAPAMSAALTRLISNPELARKMGARSRMVVEGGLNLDTYLQKIAELVREVGTKYSTQQVRHTIPSHTEAK